MDRGERNILILGALILVLLVVAYYVVLFRPLRQEYLAKYDERTQKEAQEAQLERTVADLENVRRDASDIERQILEYSKRLPSQDELPSLIVQIEEIANEANVTQLSIKPGSPEAPPGGGDFSRIPITMSFEGTYEELQDFLLRLRNLSRLVTVNEVNYERVDRGRESTGREITANRTTGGRNLLTVEIAAETYVQPAVSEATTPSSAGGTTTSAAGKATKSKASKS